MLLFSWKVWFHLYVYFTNQPRLVSLQKLLWIRAKDKGKHSVLVDDSGGEDNDHQHHEITTPATSGYDIGRKLLNLGLYGIDEEKIDGTEASEKGWINKQAPMLTAAEVAAKKKRKKVIWPNPWAIFCFSKSEASWNKLNVTISMNDF